MSNLGPQQQNLSYDGLLQVDGGISSTLKPVQDGLGNFAGLWLSSTGTNALTATDFVASVNGTPITGALPRPISDGFGDYVSVKDFGAVGDGVTDDTTAIQNAIAANVPLFWPAGTYLCGAKITFTNLSCRIWSGQGSSKTLIKFTNNAISACIEAINSSTTNWYFSGLQIVGPGKSSGSSLKGIYSTSGGPSNSYNLRFTDVGVSQCSGNGVYIDDWFQQSWVNCWARNIAGNGIVSGGDQSTSYIGTGSYFVDVDQYCLWFTGGTPFVQGVNIGDSGNGLRFGLPSSSPYGSSYCFPNIYSVNIEYIKGGGTGLRFENGSCFSYMDGITLYSDSSVGASAVAYGVYLDYILNTGFIGARGVSFYTTFGGSFAQKFYINGGGASAGSVVSLFDLSSALGGQTYRVGTFNYINGFNTNAQVNSVGLVNSGVVQNSTANIVTATTNLDLTLSANNNVYIVLADATAGSIQVYLPIATFPNGQYRHLIIKKIDSSANTVTLNTYGSQTVDGVNDPVLTTQWQYKHIIGNGTNWVVVANN